MTQFEDQSSTIKPDGIQVRCHKSQFTINAYVDPVIDAFSDLLKDSQLCFGGISAKITHIQDMGDFIPADKVLHIADLQKQLDDQNLAARKNEEETEKQRQQGSEIQSFLHSLFGSKFASSDAQQTQKKRQWCAETGKQSNAEGPKEDKAYNQAKRETC
uniref:Uncharacterized protein n=1 Tax=Oryza punctata TaxID=4537 RepID=A0A0E0JZF6_ORYPU